MSRNTQDGPLKKGASLLDVVMLAAGAAIGSSIFSVLGPAARISGASLLPAVLVAVLPMAILAVVYAAIASAAPRTSASYQWPREFIGPRFAFAVAWLRIIGSAGMLLMGASVLVRYLSLVTPLPAAPSVLLILLAVFAVNLFGISTAAKAQTIMMVILLFVFSVFVAFAAVSYTPQDRYAVPWVWHLGAIVPTLPMLVQLFAGIETATEIGEEVKNAKRAVPLGIGLAVLLTLLVYVVITVTTLSLIGVTGVQKNDTPLVTAAGVLEQGFVLPLMMGAAMLCLVKSLNVNFMIFSRNLFVLARQGVLPAPLGRLHPKWGTPHIASIAIVLLTSLGVLLPDDLIYLFIATTIPLLLKYFSTCICAIRLQRLRPDLVEQASFRLRPLTMKLLAVAGAASAVILAIAGIEADSRPYFMIAGWGILGIIYYHLRGVGSRSVSPEDQ